MGNKIKTVTAERMGAIIETRQPLGLFVFHDEKAGVWVACDNSDGDAWTEEFSTIHRAKGWLKR